MQYPELYCRYLILKADTVKHITFTHEIFAIEYSGQKSCFKKIRVASNSWRKIRVLQYRESGSGTYLCRLQKPYLVSRQTSGISADAPVKIG